MWHENGRGMQNPGDLRVPPGVEIRPKRRVLILGKGAVLAARERFDEVVPLNGVGVEPTVEEEKLELALTTRP